jgi:hypothetical protein
MERLAKDKHSGVLQKSENYDRKKFNCTGPMGEANALAYFASHLVTKKKKSFITSNSRRVVGPRLPGTNVIKLFTAVGFDFL